MWVICKIWKIIERKVNKFAKKKSGSSKIRIAGTRPPICLKNSAIFLPWAQAQASTSFFVNLTCSISDIFRVSASSRHQENSNELWTVYCFGTGNPKKLEGPICHRCTVSDAVSDLMSFVLYTATATGLW